jgi:hypothetical protein
MNGKKVAIIAWVAAAILAFFVIKHIMQINKTIKATQI